MEAASGRGGSITGMQDEAQRGSKPSPHLPPGAGRARGGKKWYVERPPHPAAAPVPVRRSGLDQFFTLCGATCRELKLFVIIVFTLDLGAALLLRLVVAYYLVPQPLSAVVGAAITTGITTPVTPSGPPPRTADTPLKGVLGTGRVS
jgi:hypothetical protein